MKATSEPKTTRYASASQDFPETAPTEKPPSSPPPAAMASSTSPPTSISIVVRASGSAGTGRRVTSSEPAAHRKEASTHTPA